MYRFKDWIDCACIHNLALMDDVDTYVSTDLILSSTGYCFIQDKKQNLNKGFNLPS